MLERMEMMLERVVGAGLTLRADKFIFFSLCCDFLGHRLSREDIGVSPSKTEAIRGIDPFSINTVTAVRSLLGCTGFNRKCIRNYALISRPLVDLTKKNEDVGLLSRAPEVQEAISKEAQFSSQERRDTRRREPTYEKGDGVLLRRPVEDKSSVPAGGKLTNIYEGPYRIAEVLERGNVRLRDLPR